MPDPRAPWDQEVRARISPLGLSPTRERDVVDELLQHIDDHYRELVAGGASPDEAERIALAAFRASDVLTDRLARLRQSFAPAPATVGPSRGHMLGDVWQDLRYAVRACARQPGFTAAAVLSLALGIGVNTTMFTVVYGVLLRPLPYLEADRLVRLVQSGAGDVTMPEYEFVRDHGSTFTAVAAYRGGGERRIGPPERQNWVSTVMVSTTFLEALGVRPQLGREFTVEETRAGGPPAVMLSDATWRSVFNADPTILDRSIELNGISMPVVGVLPEGFWFHQPLDIALPLRNTGSIGDTGTNTQLIARLADGVSMGQAQVAVSLLTEQIRASAQANLPGDYRGLALRGFQEWLVGDVRLNLLLLFGATGVLLLIACGNLALLLLARFATRARELAVRTALGSSRRRMLAQFLTEHLFLAALGAAAGVAAAQALVRIFVAMTPFDLPTAADIRLNGTVLAFTIAATVATALFVTLVPFLGSPKLNIAQMLRSESKQAAGVVRARTRHVFIVSEVALASTLLVAAGLLIQTLYQTTQQQLGFVPGHVVTFETPFATERQKNAADRLTFTRLLLERLAATPGMLDVAATNMLPLIGQSNLPTQRDGHPEHSIGGMEVRTVTADYFDVMGMPLRHGRAIGPQDVDRGAPVAVISERVANAWWPDGSAIGDRLTIGRFQGKVLLEDVSREVIGVVGDAKALTLQAAPRPTVYVPVTSPLGSYASIWVVKTDGGSNLAASIQAAVAAIDPAQRVVRVRPMQDIVASAAARPRFNASLFGVFAAVALALTIVGLYGVLSFLVTQRRQEIGTRMALGASRGDILRAVVRTGLSLTAVGLVLGLLGALAIVRSLSALLFGVPPTDLASFAAVALLVLAVGCAASYLPARRASTIDPLSAMRAE